MDSMDSTWMLSVDWPQVEDLKHVSNSSNHGASRFLPTKKAPWLDILPVTHRNLPCHFHLNPPETHVSLGGGILSTCCESNCPLWTLQRHLIRYGPCNHTHTYWLANQPSCNNIYVGACSFYTTHNFLHPLGHPLQQLLLMEEMRLTNSYPVRYMYGTLTAFGWSLCLNL